MALTMSKLETLYAMLVNEARIISAGSDHRNWFPCGSAYLQVDGRSPIVTFLKKNPMNSRFHLMKAQRGYWLTAKLDWKDVYEAQNQGYSIRVHEALQKLLLDEGISSDVCSYID